MATVDADGAVTARGAGTATITARSATQATTSAITVHAAGAATASALISTALKQGRISEEQALTYRVFAFFGDARLPGDYAGAAGGAPDHHLMRELAGRLPTLTAATQDLLLPFLLPPIYEESWHAQQLAPQATVASERMRALASRSQNRGDGRPQANATSVNCRVAQSPTGWLRRTTAHFNIYYPDVQPATQAEANISEAIASVVEEVYQSLTSLLGRFPISDLGLACNGGDGAVDIYLNYFMPGKQFAVTSTYPGNCENSASFISVNSSHPLFRVDAAQRPADANVLRAVKLVMAHEMAHVLQFTMDRKAACDDYVWVDEATAVWSADHVDPSFDHEDGFNHQSPAGTRTGSFLLRYLARDHLASIEKPGSDESISDHGYSEYLFFQFIARKYGSNVIRLVHDAQIGQASVEALETAISPQGGMKTVWPEFARTLWIGASERVLDYWSTTDRYDYGLSHIYQKTGGDAFALAQTKLETLKVDQKGQPRATFELLRNALTFGSGNYEIEQRSMLYEHFRFTDPTVRSVILVNPIAILPGHDRMKVQAVKKIGGVWKAIEDWTEDATKSFCLDRKDERVEELILIVSNSAVDRGAGEPFRIPDAFPMRLSTSNVGCWRWTGTSSTTTTYDDGNLVGTSTGSGVVQWDVRDLLPGSVQFEPQAGFIDGSSSGHLGACTFTENAARRTLDANGPAAGRLYIGLDLDLGFGQSPDRTLTAFDGFADMVSTRTMACPGSVVTSTGPIGFTWLQVESAAKHAVSADGTTLEGQYIASFAATRSTIKTVFKFTAQRE